MTPTDADYEGLDLMDLAASDAWLDGVAGRTPDSADLLATALVSWLDRIDSEYVAGAALPAAGSADVATPADIRSVRRFRGRSLAAVAVLGVASLASAGVAAASPGSPLYPAHRVVFGSAHPHHSALDHAAALLNQAGTLITSAQRQHRLSDSAQAKATALLDQAKSLLDSAPSGAHRDELLARYRSLSAALASLVALVAHATQSPLALHPSATSGADSAPGSHAGTDTSTGSNDRHGFGRSGFGFGHGGRSQESGPSDGHGSTAGGDHHGSSSGSKDRHGSSSGTGDRQGSSGSSDHGSTAASKDGQGSSASGDHQGSGSGGHHGSDSGSGGGGESGSGHESGG